jgi:hypothetical protein
MRFGASYVCVILHSLDSLTGRNVDKGVVEDILKGPSPSSDEGGLDTLEETTLGLDRSQVVHIKKEKTDSWISLPWRNGSPVMYTEFASTPWRYPRRPRTGTAAAPSPQ